MNISSIENVVGSEYLNQILTIINIDVFAFWYIMPWFASIVIIMNLTVVIMSAIIYTNTKQENHNPAFVFIGALAVSDAFITM